MSRWGAVRPQSQTKAHQSIFLSHRFITRERDSASVVVSPHQRADVSIDISPIRFPRVLIDITISPTISGEMHPMMGNVKFSIFYFKQRISTPRFFIFYFIRRQILISPASTWASGRRTSSTKAKGMRTVRPDCVIKSSSKVRSSSFPCSSRFFLNGPPLFKGLRV